MKNYKKAFLGSVVATVLSSSGVMAQDVTLRFSHYLPPQHALPSNGFKNWMESISEDSNESINFQVFPSQQLGSATDHYDMVAMGIADVAWINSGYTAGRFPIADALQLPFLVNNNTKDAAVAATEWYRNYAHSEMSEVIMCVMHGHYPGTLHSKEEIRSPDQISGMTIRPAGSSIAQLVSALGGASVQVPPPEAREALARGTADAITFPYNSARLFGIDQIVSYSIDYPIYSSWQAIVINKASYEEMSDDQKEVIDSHCTGEWARKVTEYWDDWEREGYEELKNSSNHVLVKLSESEENNWIEASKPLYDQWENKVNNAGYDAIELMDDLRRRLVEVDALLIDE